jgi:hypothetical protein
MILCPTLGGGGLRLRGMTSVAGLIDHEGTPSLLQTGGTYRHGYIHDRQHPEDLVMEAAADLQLGRGFVYLAPVGAPALGPAPYMHRPSSAADPTAPIGHHWQDATHVSYGVATVGARAAGLTLEASAFNARESDFKSALPDWSHGRLDSFAGRVGFAKDGVGLSSWWGYLKEHDPIAPAMQMHRYGASIGFDKGRSSSLAVWGMNVHHHDGQSHLLLHGDPSASPHTHASSLLLESTIAVNSKTALFGRAERVMKDGEELGFSGGNLTMLSEIRTVALGGQRDVASLRFTTLSLGARASVSFLPSTLESAYGSRSPRGLDLFLQARRAP